MNSKTPISQKERWGFDLQFCISVIQEFEILAEYALI